MKIAVLNVATRKYINLFQDSKNHIKNNFLPSHDVDVFLFTDSDEEFTDDKVNIYKYYVKGKGFPADTLFRYHYFLLAEEKLKEYDFIYYIDVDMRVVSKVNDNIFGDLVATIHPGFYNRPGATYETRKTSTAYVEDTKRMPYFCGGFQGGKPDTYLKAAKQIKNNINIDGKNGIMAIWHDESHWNAYLNKNKPSLILNPDYCYPQEEYGWLSQFKDNKKIIALIKNEKELRSN